MFELCLKVLCWVQDFQVRGLRFRLFSFRALGWMVWGLGLRVSRVDQKAMPSFWAYWEILRYFQSLPPINKSPHPG